MNTQEAFWTICDNAKPKEQWYVSLYVDISFYGGPEEGGWYGSDTKLIAFQEFPSEELAQIAKKNTEQLAKEKTKDSKRTNDEKCLREMEWLEARNLDADFLPEVTGGDKYWVVIERKPGSHERQGCRHYE